MGLLLLLFACAGLRDLVPEGPVLSYSERMLGFAAPTPSGVHYTGPPTVEMPVPPVQFWGVRYDLDLTLRTRQDDWDMHEYARILGPQGVIWLIKDARAGVLTQSILTDFDNSDWLPEVPVERGRSDVEVVDRSDARHIDVDLSYVNLDGVPVELTYTGRMPKAVQSKRNSSNMGHSANTLVPVLDLSRRAFGRVRMSIGGERVRARKILGLVPFSLALVQAQAGFSVGDITWTVGEQIYSEHASGTVQRWSWTPTSTGGVLQQEGELRTLRYRFAGDGAALELLDVTVLQYGAETAVGHVRFEPALPDVRRPFEGSFEGRWVVDVGGQASHASGLVTAWWGQDGPEVHLRGLAPRWVEDRVLRTSVRLLGESARTIITRP